MSASVDGDPVLFELAEPAVAAVELGRVSDRQLLGYLRAFIAPVAQDSGAVATDPRVVQLAREMAAAFADHAGTQGMTRAEVAAVLARTSAVYDEALFHSRFELFEAMGLIQPYLSKRHQNRYVLNPAGLAGLLAFERLGARGGVDEMLQLLDRTRWLLEQGAVDRDTLVDQMRRCRQMLSVYTSALARLVETAPVAELIDEQRHHDPRRVEAQVHTLNKLVTARYGRDFDLNDLAFRLVEAALAYRKQVLDAIDHVLDLGGASLDFSVLTAEEYLAAAINADLDALAEVGSQLVVDPPQPWVEPGAVIEVLDEYAPRRQVRVRPPEPTGGAEADPVAAMQRRHDQRLAARRLRAESHLQDRPEVELTGTLRGMRWQAAAETLVDLLTLSGDPRQPFTVELGQMLLIDSDVEATYFHPVTLRRADRTASSTDAPLHADSVTSDQLPVGQPREQP